MSFASESVNASGNHSPGGLSPASPKLSAEIQRAAEQLVGQRLRHITIDTPVIQSIRKLAIHRTAERLVQESRPHGQSKPH